MVLVHFTTLCTKKIDKFMYNSLVKIHKIAPYKNKVCKFLLMVTYTLYLHSLFTIVFYTQNVK